MTGFTAGGGMFESLFGRVAVLTGPTASGKTRLALEVDRVMRRRAGRDEPVLEIISLDSVAVYTGMDIGSAKPTPRERAEVPHHLIDVVAPDQSFSVAEYLVQSHRLTEQILASGRRVLFVGGTPMYLKAIVRGFDPGPPADESFRQQVETDVAAHGVESLRQRLRHVDPLAAAKIDPNDVRRITRALEFSHLTGRPISHHQTHFARSQPASQGAVFSLAVPRPNLHQRIDQRVEVMFRDGLVEEVRGLIARYGELSKTASQAVGYREVLAAIQSGQDPAATLTQVQTNTRRLAKRQETWFRSFSEIRTLQTSVGPTPVPLTMLAETMATVIEAHDRPSRRPRPIDRESS